MEVIRNIYEKTETGYVRIFPETDISAVVDFNHPIRAEIYNDIPSTVDEDGSIQRSNALLLSEARTIIAAATTNSTASAYLMGGSSVSSVSDVVERYNSDGTIDVLAPLYTARTMAAAVADINDNVIIAGGFNYLLDTEYLDSVEMYSPAGLKTTLEPLSVGRRSLVSCRVGNAVMFAGGNAEGPTGSPVATDVVDIYHADGTHEIGTPLSIARQSLSGCNIGSLTDNGYKTIIMGGRDYSGLAIVELYDEFQVHSIIEPMLYARSSFSAVHSTDGSVWIAGGYGASMMVEKYTLEPNTSIEMDYLSVGKTHLYGGPMYDNTVIFGGGLESITVDLYQPDGTRTTLEPLSDTRYRTTGIIIGDGSMIFASGESSAVVDRYDKPRLGYMCRVPGKMKYWLKSNPSDIKYTMDDIVVEIPERDTLYLAIGGEYNV